MYKMKLLSIKTWNNNVVETLKYNCKNGLETALDYKNLASNKTEYCSDEFKKRRCEIQDCEHF